MDNLSKILENLDKETFNPQQERKFEVDSGTVSKVSNDHNGYYIDFYVNVGKNLSNSGTYTVKKEVLVLIY